MRSYILASVFVLCFGTLSVYSQHGSTFDSQVIHHVQLQEDGRLFGKLAVEYVTGKAVPAKATVEVFKDQTRLDSTRASERGEFHLMGLAPGSYSVKSEVGGKTSSMLLQVHSSGTGKVDAMLSVKISPTLDHLLASKNLERSAGRRADGIVYEAETTHDDIVLGNHIHFAKGKATWVSSMVGKAHVELNEEISEEAADGAESASDDGQEAVVMGDASSTRVGGFVRSAKSRGVGADFVTPTSGVRAATRSQANVRSFANLTAVRSSAVQPTVLAAGTSTIAAPTVPVNKTGSPDPLTDLFEVPDFQAASPAQ